MAISSPVPIYVYHCLNSTDYISMLLFQATNNSVFSLEETEWTIFTRESLYVVVYLATVSIVGTFGNIHVLLVYPRFKRSNFKILVTVLAVNDLAACIIGTSFEIIDKRYTLTFENAFACKFFRLCSFVFSFASWFLLGLVAIERWKKVVKPLKSQMSRKQTAISCACVVGFSALLSIPAIFLYGIKEETVPGVLNNQLMGKSCSGIDNRDSSIFFACLLFVSLGVLVQLIIMYTCIMIKLRKQRRRSVGKNTKHLLIQKNEQDTLNQSLELSTNSNDNTVEPVSTSSSGKITCSLMVKDKSGNSATSKQIKQRRFSVESATASKKMDKTIRMTLMFIIVSFVSYVGVFPVMVLSIISVVDDDYSRQIEANIGQFKSILMRGYFINHVVNPFVYCFFDAHFRKDCKRLYSSKYKLSCKCTCGWQQ